MIKELRGYRNIPILVYHRATIIKELRGYSTIPILVYHRATMIKELRGYSNIPILYTLFNCYWLGDSSARRRIYRVVAQNHGKGNPKP